MRHVPQVARFVMGLAVAWLAAGLVSGAELIPHGAVFALVEENDCFARTDRHYTQGAKLSFLHSEGVASNFFSCLPLLGFRESLGRIGYAIGQNIYTPEATKASAPVLNDRPYAGWLYASLIAQRRGRAWWDLPQLESLELELGVVGSWSGAQPVQELAHELLRFNSPSGWKNQLHNEPAGQLKYSRSVRLRAFESGAFAVEAIPLAGFSAGTISCTARGGAILRLGLNLPDDFGAQSIGSLQTTAGGHAGSEHRRFGFYIFGGGEGRAVARDEFLDGNAFHDSHSVGKRPFVGEYSAGAVLVFHHLEAGYVHTFRGQEYRGQLADDSFGSIFVRVLF